MQKYTISNALEYIFYDQYNRKGKGVFAFAKLSGSDD